MRSKDTTTITLTRGYSATIDTAYLDLVNRYSWVALTSGKRIYAVSRDGGGYLLMHRLITEAPPKSDVDHIDGDTLNNTRANLRIASRSQNMANTSVRSTNKSGYKGVSWHAGARKWRSTIKVDGKQIHLGFFLSAADAGKAYDLAAIEHWGDFAHLNFPYTAT